MAPNSNADPIRSRLRAALDEIYGDRLERVVLCGSRARGQGRPDSDYDIAVFIQDLGDERLPRIAQVSGSGEPHRRLGRGIAGRPRSRLPGEPGVDA